MGPLRIEDYAIIGDCRAAALVGNNGSIDWLCWPQFESASIFARMLDPSAGHWIIHPPGEYKTHRCYIQDSNVLQTVFQSAHGECTLTDLMPVCSEDHKRGHLVADHEILRRVECTSGEMEMEVRFCPRPDYGRVVPRIHFRPKLGHCIPVGRGIYWLRAECPMKMEEGALHARVRLRAGESVTFSLSYSEEAPAVLPLLGASATSRIKDSVEWWQQWARQAKYDGPHREQVVRSALALKLLAYAPSGAILAAPTTSLPERIGGRDNWDYRFCWLRDASFTVRALTGLGYLDEANAFLSWMLHATRLSKPRLKVLYSVYGQHARVETELEHLRGFHDSRPVRIGNGARDQLQLDVYGEVVDAAAQLAFDGRRFDRQTQKVLIGWGKYVAAHWQQPDQGLWEPRGAPQPHTHSRLMCWAALDRLCKLADDGLIVKDAQETFRRERDCIQKEIEEHAWDAAANSYSAIVGGHQLDASLLLLSWYGLSAADGERMQGTYRAIASHLRAGRGLLHRNRRIAGEGAFVLCSFWEVEFLASGGGTLASAQELFEHLLTFTNDVGLLAEEIDPGSGGALGNFPQGFSHVGLIGAALALEARAKGMEQLPHQGDSPANHSEVAA